MPLTDRDILIGKVVGPFGIRGEVKVLVLTDFPERFDVGRKIALITTTDERRVIRIKAGRPHGGGLLLKLEGVESRNDAEALRGAHIAIDRDELGELQEGSFYVFDIIGLKVVTDDGREFGEVTEVLQGGANDAYCTSTGLCIPALKDVVVKVDIPGRVMVIRPMPGLLPGE